MKRHPNIFRYVVQQIALIRNNRIIKLFCHPESVLDDSQVVLLGNKTFQSLSQSLDEKYFSSVLGRSKFRALRNVGNLLRDLFSLGVGDQQKDLDLCAPDVKLTIWSNFATSAFTSAKW